MTRHHNKRGFNLIEAAIVLAVVGAVIGTIWGVSAHFYEDYKVNKTAADLALIVNGIQDLISIKDSEAIGNVVSITELAKGSNLFAGDWYNPKINYFNNPLTPGSGAGKGGNIFNYSGYFELALYGPVKESVCSSFLMRFSSIPEIKKNLKSIGTYDFEYGTIRNVTTFPISQTNISLLCSGGSWDIVFKFYYTRIN